MSSAPATGCPDEEVLVEFAAGLLAAAEMPRIEAHLDACVDCAWLAGQLIGGREPAAGEHSAAGPPQVSAGKFARYRLRQIIGSGGMGTVYEAEDESLGRRVALKLQRASGPPGEEKTRTERFLREARITAMLQHPNIVPVLEVGALADGTPYYTQRLVAGRSLAKALAAARDLRARLELLPHFLDLCNAIAYAHGRGVIHRDIKPGNVMVGAFGETVVVDWGLARLRRPQRSPAPEQPRPTSVPDGLTPPLGTAAVVLARAGETVEGQALGTPGYMSPEQAEGRLDLVDERSDVFSLGAVLFEILTGRPPFTGKSHEDLLRRALAGPLPEARGEGVPPDLAAVAAKALSPERATRYADAAQMEADVTAWSEGRLVSVYRYSSFQRVQRFANRHRTATLSAVAALLVCGAFLGSVLGRNIEARHQRADELLARAFRYGAGAQWDRVGTYYAGARVARDLPQARWGLAVTGATGLLPLYKLKRRAWQAQALAAAPDGKSFAAAGDDRMVRIFETETGLERVRLAVGGPITALLYTPDGATLIGAAGQALEFFNPLRGTHEGRFEVQGEVAALAVSPDGARLAGATGDEVRVWDLASRRALAATQSTAPVETLAFLPSGEVVFGGAGLEGVRRWNPARPEEPPLVFGPTDLGVHQVAGCAGPLLAVSDRSANAFLWKLNGGSPETQVLAGANCKEFTLASDCRTLVCLGESGRLRFWDTESRSMFGSIAGSLLRALAGVLTPDGRRLIVSNSDHAVRVWGEGASRVHVGHRGSGVRPSSLAWSAGGLLASADGSGRVQLWNPATGEPGKEHFVHQGGARAIAFPRSTAGSGGRWASAGLDGVRLWEGTSPLPDRVLPDPTTALAFAPSGELLAAGGQDGALRLLSLTGQPTLTLPAHSREVHAVAFSPDGSRLASSSADGSVLLWDPRTRRLVARLEGLEGEAKALAFSPDGLTLVSGSQGHALRLWSPDDGRPLGALQTANTGENLALAFAPLGAAPASGLLLASSLRGLHLWDVDRRAAQMELGGFHFLVGLAFSPDGRRAALLRDDGLLTLLQLDGVNQLGSPARDLEGLMKLYKYVADAGDLIRDEEELRPPAERK